MAIPIALTIAGSDPSGGAGVQADLKTFSALGCYGAAVLTALTAQNTRGVSAVHEVSSAFVAAQIDAVLSDLPVRAVKTGMLGAPAVVEAVADRLRAFDGPIVCDPVMIAKSGAALLPPESVAKLKAALLPRCRLLTPNLPEAAALLGVDEAEVRADLEGAARRLLDLGPAAVLLKGGHLGGPESEDLLTAEGLLLRLRAPRIETTNTHGTGCTLSAAIAAELAQGRSLSEAARRAKEYLSGALRAADELQVGAGIGPVHHFHALWQRRR